MLVCGFEICENYILTFFTIKLTEPVFVYMTHLTLRFYCDDYSVCIYYKLPALTGCAMYVCETGEATYSTSPVHSRPTIRASPSTEAGKGRRGSRGQRCNQTSGHPKDASPESSAKLSKKPWCCTLIL